MAEKKGKFRKQRRRYFPGNTEEEHVVHIRPVHHPEVNFITRHGRFIGEADVTPDEVLAVDTPHGKTLYFQAGGTGRLRFFCMNKDGKEHIAARGVPARLITDFDPTEAVQADTRLAAIRERKRKHV